MQQRDSLASEHTGQLFESFGSGSEIELLGFLNDRINDVALPSAGNLLGNASIHLIGFALEHMGRADRHPARRLFVNYREVKVAVQCHRQRAWYRCRRHDESVRPFPLRHQLQALNHTKPMLLVDDDESQIFEDRALLNEDVRANSNLNLSRLESLEQLPFLCSFDSATKDTDGITQRRQDALGVEIVLLRKNFRGRHDGGL